MWKNKKTYPIKDEGLYLLIIRFDSRLFVNIEFRLFTGTGMVWKTLTSEFEYFSSLAFKEDTQDFLKSKYIREDRPLTLEKIEDEGEDISQKTGIYGLISEDNEFVSPIAKDEAIFYLRIPPDPYLFNGLLNNESIVPISSSKRLKIFERDRFKCKICGISPAIQDDVKLVIDHIYPTSLGGSNHEQNLQTLCKECNSKKSNIVHFYDLAQVS